LNFGRGRYTLLERFVATDQMLFSREISWSARSAARILAVGGVLLAGGVLAGPARADTKIFSAVGTESIFVVPAGVHDLSIVAIGGSGGDAQDGKGGAGAKVSGHLGVTPGQTLYVEVGENGKDIGEGGGAAYNGGAAGGGGGGGASDIRIAPAALGLSPDPRLLVAGAGGGAGASGPSEPGGSGGAAETAGENTIYTGGGPGTQEKGGEAFQGCGGSFGGKGVLGSGGAGGNPGPIGPGGGGGGGFYGGGGGAGSCEIASAGGGGGSSRVPPLGSSVLASPTASPLVEITWEPPPPGPAVGNTVLGSHPKKTIKTTKKKVKVKFSFSSNVAGATFKCKLDKGSFSVCTSPKSYKVKLGSHTFSVKAVTAGGTDPTPAKFSFKVKKKK
jgi:Glycine rich protein